MYNSTTNVAPLLVGPNGAGGNIDALGGDSGLNTYDVVYNSFANSISGTRQNTSTQLTNTTHSHTVNLNSTPVDISHTH